MAPLSALSAVFGGPLAATGRCSTDRIVLAGHRRFVLAVACMPSGQASCVGLAPGDSNDCIS